MIRSLLLAAATLALAAPAILAAAQSDPQARADLERLRAKYEQAGTLDARVALEIQFPEQPAEVQEGRIRQDGDRYRVEFDRQVVISDGSTVWMYLPDNQEVQVYDAEDGSASDGFMRPQDFLTIYDNDGFEYALAGEVAEGGTTLRQIEFKPTDRGSEFAKVRMTYDPRSLEVRRVKVFNKDGSRFTLSLTSLNSGAALPAALFRFDETAHPGVMVEDMRL